MFRGIHGRLELGLSGKDKSQAGTVLPVLLARRRGSNHGLQRFRCPQCKRTDTEVHRRTLGSMYIPEAKATLALQLLLEGNSIRSTQRITQLDRNTIMRLLVLAGDRCQRLMDAKMRNLHLKHLQIDEIWTYLAKKQRHRNKRNSSQCNYIMQRSIASLTSLRKAPNGSIKRAKHGRGGCHILPRI